jgi:hypothetical protein
MSIASLYAAMAAPYLPSAGTGGREGGGQAACTTRAFAHALRGSKGRARAATQATAGTQARRGASHAPPRTIEQAVGVVLQRGRPGLCVGGDQLDGGGRVARLARGAGGGRAHAARLAGHAGAARVLHIEGWPGCAGGGVPRWGAICRRAGAAFLGRALAPTAPLPLSPPPRPTFLTPFRAHPPTTSKWVSASSPRCGIAPPRRCRPAGPRNADGWWRGDGRVPAPCFLPRRALASAQPPHPMAAYRRPSAG